MWDDKGNSWLDFSSQMVNVNIGHQHPRMVAAIKDQADRLCTIGPPMANDMRSEAARLITDLAPGDLNMVFFTNGGAEAIENATRMARLHTERHKVLSTYKSYHGATAGAISLTGEGRRWDSEPGVPGAVKFWGPYPYRSAFNATSHAEECERALAHLRSTVTAEGPQHIAAILLETVVGTNGILVPPDGYLQGVRELCDEHGIMMICDEVMAGFGRCGEWFAFDHWDITPDLVAFAKGVNSGYVPLGGVIIKQADRRHVPRPRVPGRPHLLRSSVGVRERRRQHQHLQGRGHRRARPPSGRRHHRPRRSRISPPATRAWATCAASASSGRSNWSRIDRRRRRSTRPRWARSIAACKDGGVWPFAPANRIHVVPPLTISDDELREGLAVIDEALTVADNAVTPRTVCFRPRRAASDADSTGFGCRWFRRRPLRG